MSALATESYRTPDEVLFRPPIAVPFQLRDIARAYLDGRMMATWDTGVGKTALTIGVGCVAIEQGAADHVLIVCEQNKVTDWKREWAKFSALPDEEVATYYGPKRKALLAALPRVIITSYETGRQDAAIFETARKMHDGPLTEALAGRRVLVAYDESSKLGNRSSKLYKAHARLLAALRKGYPATRVLQLTGTPMDGGGYIQFFNQLRLLAPDVMPNVTEWERKVIKYWKEVGVGGRVPVYDSAGVEWFRQLAAPLLSRRRKSDPEVREHFPPFTEKFEPVTMRGDQRELYAKLEDLAWNEDNEFQQVPGLSQLLYQLAGDPLAVQYAAERGGGDLAKMVWRVLGDELRRCSSAKAEYLWDWYVDPIVQSGNKLLVFSFFGQTVLPALYDRLERKFPHGDRPLFIYHGGMSQAARDVALDNFRDYPGGAVMLCSDAAAKGLNIPQASYTVEYEVARTSAIRTQRAGRGHRFGGTDPVTFVTLSLEGTAEVRSAVPRMLERNEQQDLMLGDIGVDGYTTAEDRRELFSNARKRKVSS
jgi:SNF2-related domain/Helicase conserved C-terminal domain